MCLVSTVLDSAHCLHDVWNSMFQISCLFLPEIALEFTTGPTCDLLCSGTPLLAVNERTWTFPVKLSTTTLYAPRHPSIVSFLSTNVCLLYPTSLVTLFGLTCCLLLYFSKLRHFVLSPPMATILTLPLHVLDFVLYMCLLCFSKFGFLNSFTCLLYIYSQPCVFC